MAAQHVTELSDRGVVHVAGADAIHFIQNLVTCDVEELSETKGAYGALLTPQGKIVVDFLVARESDGGLLFDLPAASVAEFVKRLTVYKMRAKVTVADLSEESGVLAFWGLENAPMLPGPVFRDPRLAGLGLRAIVPKTIAKGSFGVSHLVRTDEGAYHRHRIALGVPEAERDFRLGEAFPHDADLDQLQGVDFRKGCYVGQEIVSRMQHRGTARRRIVQVSAAGDLPQAGTPLTAASRAVGTLGSAVGREGLALVRLDRAKEALDGGVPIKADQVTVELALPAWATFTWPNAGTPAA